MASRRSTISAVKLALASRDAYDPGSARGHDPIAIVGMGCRFPGGVNSPDDYWRFLVEGRDAVTEVPHTRWNPNALLPAFSRPGETTARWGSFLPAIDRFDAAFFGISANEAASMDPQHRLLLEVAWEALEDAGYTKTRLAGERAGVFVALYNTDYREAVHADPAAIEAYSTVGTSPSLAAGRLAYLLDLRGPNLVVDTACSSSLVAVHLACESLRQRSSEIGIVGAASLILSPAATLSLSKWGFMSPDGHCRPFAAAANVWVRGDGGGAVVLRRHADALAAGDRILAEPFYLLLQMLGEKLAFEVNSVPDEM